MKKIVIFLFLASFTLKSSGQSLIDSLMSTGFSYNDSIGLKLVDLAMNNPVLGLIDKQIEGSKYEVSALKGSWLNVFTASFNMNEYNIQGSKDSLQNLFYPRYNFGLTIPMGIWFTKPAQIKSAKANTEVLKFRKDVEKNRLKTAILEAYQRYQWNKYVLALEETILRDEQILYKEVEKKFTNKEIGLAPFTEASRRFSSAVNRRITLMRDVNIAKYELESLIGMTYEDAMVKLNIKP